MEEIRRIPYLFSSRTTLLASGDGQINFQVDSSYDYMCTGWSYKATGIFEIQFMDNERKLMYDYLQCELFNGLYAAVVSGDRHWNTFKPHGYLFKAKSNININLRDTSVAGNTVKIGLDGYRIYR